MTRHDQILEALKALLMADGFFPAPSLDLPEPDTWRDGAEFGQPNDVQDAANIADGPVTVTRDGGAEDDYELQLEAAVAYAVAGVDDATRRARRDEAQQRIAALIAANRTLGLTDPAWAAQVYAQITDVHTDNAAPIPHACPVATVVCTITVDYVASSPAG